MSTQNTITNPEKMENTTKLHPNQLEHNVAYLELFESQEYRDLPTEEQFKFIECYCEHIAPYTHLKMKVPYIKVWGDEKKHYDWFPQQHDVCISFSLCNVKDAYSGNFKVMSEYTHSIELFTNTNVMMKYYNRLYTLLERFETEKWVTT